MQHKNKIPEIRRTHMPRMFNFISKYSDWQQMRDFWLDFHIDFVDNTNFRDIARFQHGFKDTFLISFAFFIKFFLIIQTSNRPVIQRFVVLLFSTNVSIHFRAQGLIDIIYADILFLLLTPSDCQSYYLISARTGTFVFFGNVPCTVHPTVGL